MTMSAPVPEMLYHGLLQKVLPQPQNWETDIAACHVVIKIWNGEAVYVHQNCTDITVNHLL